MKGLFYFLLFVATQMWSQGNTENTALTYEEVIQVEGISQDELYNRAKIWFVNNFRSANDVIQQESKEEGQIIGKGNFEYNSNVFVGNQATKGRIKFTVSIYVKEGRYKYVISDFVHEPYGNQYGKESFGLITTSNGYPDEKAKSKSWRDKVWKDIKAQIEERMPAIIQTIKEGMIKQSESKKNDW